jgi:hypothetical protein
MTAILPWTFNEVIFVCQRRASLPAKQLENGKNAMEENRRHADESLVIEMPLRS